MFRRRDNIFFRGFLFQYHGGSSIKGHSLVYSTNKYPTLGEYYFTSVDKYYYYRIPTEELSYNMKTNKEAKSLLDKEW